MCDTLGRDIKRRMFSFKYRRKFIVVAVCVFTLVTVHNILLQGTFHHNRSWSKVGWAKTLVENVTKRVYSSNSLTRLMAERIDQKSRDNIHNDLDSSVINILSNDSFKSQFLIYNKTHILYIPTAKLIKVNERIDEANGVTDRPRDGQLQHSNTSSKLQKTPSNNTEQEVDSNPGKSTEVDKNEVDDAEDLDNEFDITDLDDHITFPQQRKREQQQQQEQQQQRQQNTKEKQIFERNRLKWNGRYDTKLNNTLEYREQIYKAHVRPIQNIAGVDCNAIIEKNEDSEIEKARDLMKQISRRGITTERYARTKDCENFRGGRGYIDHPLTQMELDFPLAFEITVYKDVEQVERLLRAIYRPHNFYCLHLDLKMSSIERTAFESIARCLNNVFIADRSVDVKWGEFSVLEAELLCMEKLWQYKWWKYYINLTGQEFPLKTNREIVAILNSLEGANIVDGTWIRARHKYFYRWTVAGKPPPHRIRPIKGSVHVALNRHFVDFALHDQRSLDFLEWLKKTQIPDETFYASLNHNPHLGINGSFLGEAEEYPLKPSLMRYKNWEMGHAVFVRDCAGKYVRNICVLGVGDLHKAYNDIGLFVNKFNIDFEYLALDCLEEILYKKTWDQYLNDVSIDTTYFKHLDYVKNKVYVPPN